MKWFYSGSKELDGEQKSPDKSLGGFRSSTVVPNGRINSMFNDFSYLTIQDGFRETKAFFIKNTFNYSVENISLYATYPENPKIDFQISPVAGSVMEELKTGLDIPYYSEFFDCKVVFAFSNMTVSNTFEVGEVVMIEGVSISVPDGTLETFMNNAVKAFATDPTYEAIRTETNVLQLVHRLVGVFTNTPVIVTVNPSTIVAPDFSGGFDNSRLISNSLAPGESVGIFLKREPDGFSLKKTKEEYAAWCEEFEASGFTKIQNTDTKTVNFCLEFSQV